MFDLSASIVDVSLELGNSAALLRLGLGVSEPILLNSVCVLTLCVVDVCVYVCTVNVSTHIPARMHACVCVCVLRSICYVGVISPTHHKCVLHHTFTHPCRSETRQVLGAVPGDDPKHLSFISPVVFFSPRKKERREKKGGVLFLLEEWKNRARSPPEGVAGL